MLPAAVTTLPEMTRDGTYTVRLRCVYAGKPVSLSGYTARLSIDGVSREAVLAKEPAGETGVVEATLSRAQTKTLTAGSVGFALWLEQEAGVLGWPIVEGEIPVHESRAP